MPSGKKYRPDGPLFGIPGKTGQYRRRRAGGGGQPKDSEGTGHRNESVPWLWRQRSLKDITPSSPLSLLRLLNRFLILSFKQKMLINIPDCKLEAADVYKQGQPSMSPSCSKMHPLNVHAMWGWHQSERALCIYHAERQDPGGPAREILAGPLQPSQTTLTCNPHKHTMWSRDWTSVLMWKIKWQPSV